ncbi:uncharacterized protein BDV17DRAFT_252474 [Aspergillus undulatus]|uniref:uncharacterized protein n=1 Tax=Aspergillus undulatus TaxID=1810928 RepID=UPI003CCD6DD9
MIMIIPRHTGNREGQLNGDFFYLLSSLPVMLFLTCLRRLELRRKVNSVRPIGI